ncbi:MAG: AtpZ/AtpI family protein [Planctomycetes bacterium]|nr:AtpZ/AtpI family protein [Planctomycetota bacterium]
MRTPEAANYATAGFTFAGTMLVLGGAGYFVDRAAGTQPWLLLLGLVVGAVGGFIHLVLQFSPRTQSPRAQSPREPSPREPSPAAQSPRAQYSTSERKASASEGSTRDRRSNES